jgi:hypothetical protein
MDRRVRIDFEGHVRVLDLQHVKLRHAIAIQEFTGLTVIAWQEGLSATGGVPKADFAADPAGALHRTPMFADPGWITGMAAAHWLMLAQGGEDPPPLDGDYDCDVLGFATAFIAAFLGEVKAKRPPDKPDPTVPPGRPAQSSRRTATPETNPVPPPPPVPTGSLTGS